MPDFVTRQAVNLGKVDKGMVDLQSGINLVTNGLASIKATYLADAREGDPSSFSKEHYEAALARMAALTFSLSVVFGEADSFTVEIDTKLREMAGDNLRAPYIAARTRLAGGGTVKV